MCQRHDADSRENLGSMKFIRFLRCLVKFTGVLCLTMASLSEITDSTATAEEPKSSDGKTVPTFEVTSVEFFQQKVLPLLKARCYECHSQNARRLEGGLRLDARPLVLKGGDSGAAAVPGKPVESLLIEAINYDSFEMPPKGKLPDGEIAIFRKWVELGLPWSEDGLTTEVVEHEFPLEARRQSHWAWQPVTPSSPPEVSDPHWPRTLTDRFILAGLDQHKLKPAADADRRTLIRRAYFDLIGLPPSPQQIQQFLQDRQPTPAAFEKVVDQLLKSPHFGERWGRHWLDLVRYAETLGHEFDYPLKYAHHYRDYVIRAFNNDVPYDQFVTEHIAGDLLSEPRRNPLDQTNESILGTGFWWLGELKHAPVDVKGEEAAVIDNQIDVFSRTFLGLTVACARCHDHKFDAITTADYYALAGFLQSTRRQHAYRDPHGRIQKAVELLRSIQRRAGDHLAQRYQNDRDRLVQEVAHLLHGAAEVLYGVPQPDDDSGDTGRLRDIVFADFEGSDFGDWKAEGDAFARGPISGTAERQQPVSGFTGKKLVNSYVGTDEATGTLTSPAFTIERNFIRFQIGGGHFKDRTCANLLIDGKVVRTAVGRNREQLEAHEWDVSEFSGQQGILQIVDQQKGGWGHINVDHFVFTDHRSSISTRRPTEIVARERNLDAGRLNRWVKALSAEDVQSPSHPAWAWKQLVASQTAQASSETGTSTIQNSVRSLTDRLNRDASAWNSFLKQTTSINSVRVNAPEEVRSSQPLRDWAATGWSWAHHGDESAIRHFPLFRTMAPEGQYSSAGLGTKLRGVLRSPTFTLTKPHLLYRIAGENVTVRLIIEGYVMDEYNGLLFRGCRFNVSNPAMHWERQAGDVANYVGQRAHIEIIDDGDGWVVLDDVRLADPQQSTADPVCPTNHGLLAKITDGSIQQICRAFAGMVVDFAPTDDDRTPAGNNHLAEAWALKHDLIPIGDSDRFLDELRDEAQQVAERLPAPDYALAAVDGFSEDEHVFIRGSHRNLGEVVPRRMLTAISGENQPPLTAGSGRLKLAARLLDPSDPFPARVMANRIWHHLFGRGIVASTDNFGVLGQRPTHPELLDHLAVQFVADRWSIKKLIRSLMLTRTYQMSSQVTPAYADVDPQNLWWHRMPVRRLHGESIRDAMLTVSGELDRTLFGPPVPVYLTSFMQGRGRPKGGPLDGAGRRSIYTSVNRNFLPPMMLAFDTPIPFTTIGRRTQSNVPAQALILMNDPFVVQQASRWAKRILSDQTVSVEARIGLLYEQAFARPATADEIQEGVEFLKAQAAAYEADADWATDERTWADLCHVLFNVKEFVFLN